MATYEDRVEKSVVRYEPGPLPEQVDDLGGGLPETLERGWRRDDSFAAVVVAVATAGRR